MTVVIPVDDAGFIRKCAAVMRMFRRKKGLHFINIRDILRMVLKKSVLLHTVAVSGSSIDFIQEHCEHDGLSINLGGLDLS